MSDDGQDSRYDEKGTRLELVSPSGKPHTKEFLIRNKNSLVPAKVFDKNENKVPRFFLPVARIINDRYFPIELSN